MRRLAPAFALALAGCAAIEPAAIRVSTPAVSASAAEEVLAYVTRLKSLDEAALAAETTRQRNIARRSPSPVTSLKLALALVAAPTSEDVDVQTALDAVGRSGPGTDPGVASLAGFLQGVLAERRRLRETAASAGNRARDEKRAHDATRQRAEGLQEKNLQLQQKLDALTDLEKSLATRPAQGK